MKGKKRHEFVWKILYSFVPPWMAKKFNFDYEKISVDSSPYIVISNHLTNWDMLLTGSSFKKMMYFVASDHIFRMGFVSKIIMFLVAPIVRQKSIQETQTVITMFRRLKENCNICIFVEGTTSFIGKTGEIQPAIAKFVKKAGVAMVTYRLSGAYLTLPRWARFIHRGKMYGKLAKIYSPSEIAAMSTDEIYAAIKNDLYVNAYDDQKNNPIAYRGKQPAECLETMLYLCPKCRQFSTLKSSGDTLSCPCGFSVRYNEYGYFEAAESKEEPPFSTIVDWGEWQKKEVEAIAQTMGTLESNTPVFCDDGQSLYQIARARRKDLVAKGTLCFFNNRISIMNNKDKAIEFQLDSIIEIEFITMMTIIFSTKEHKVYEIHSEHPRSALKYHELFKAWLSTKKE